MMLTKKDGRLQKNDVQESLSILHQNKKSVSVIDSRAQIDRSSSAIEYLEEICALFQRLGPDVPIIDYFYNICGESLCLRFGGTALIPLLAPPLEHLRTEPNSNPSLTINIWDGETTGMKLPLPPWGKGDQISRGEIQGLNNERIRTSKF